MNAFAQAWHEVSRAQPTDVAVMEAAKRIASKEGIDYLDAKDRVLAAEYDPNPPTPAEVAEAFRFKYL